MTSDQATTQAPPVEVGYERMTRHSAASRVTAGDTRGYKLRRALLAADVAVLVVAFLAVETSGGFDGGSGRSVLFDLAILVIATPLWVFLSHLHGLYHVDSRSADHRTADEVAPILQMTTLWSWGVLLLQWATDVRSVPLPQLLLFWATTFALLLLFRAGVRTWARHRSWYLQNALAIGHYSEVSVLADRVLRHPEYRINLAACLELSGSGVAPKGAGVSNLERVGTLGAVPLISGEADVTQVVKDLDVDRVMLAPSVGGLGARSSVLAELGELDVHLDLVPGWGETLGSRLELNQMEGLPLLTLPPARLSRSSLFVKRMLDVTLSGVGIVLLSPMLALCALAIRLDSPGPAVFRQVRIGSAGHRFHILKFRSMRIDAEQLKGDVANLALDGASLDQGVFKVVDDPRITRVGRYLRRFSMDELPQLLNVLRGEMSLVGPRPLPETEHDRVEGRLRRRAELKPGVTGLWQVHGRSDIPFRGMMDLDYLYVTNWSLWQDMKLLARTVGVVVRGRGAY